uniref:Uncharacterized protein n=1 Tax=Amphimedon queenslandica TaxID=400682 RepID=A0A1X7U220_AMPQE
MNAEETDSVSDDLHKPCASLADVASHLESCVTLRSQRRRNQCFVPNPCKKAQLKLSQLGEKNIDMYTRADSDEFHDNLTTHFPKLELAGGFEHLRQGSNKTLELIPPPPEGYSVEYLRSVITNAKLY